MRDKNLSYINFCASLDKKLSSYHLSNSLRTAVVDITTFQSSFKVVYPRDFRRLRALAILHHWLPDYIRVLIRVDLEFKNINHLNKKQRIEFKTLLSSRDCCLKYLYLTERYSGNEIFGNLVRDCLTLEIPIKHQRVVKPKIPQRKRGYDDKGSLRSSDKWLERFDFNLTQEQNKINKERDLLHKTIQKLLKYLENVQLK
jgi:hypothetical protein